ncbi:DUF2336 domain-containing protein [Devosia algicola]|uniref:DUF2336 domain-containing protein n=1 Tax=Devosia algicola TaxID=3026418 RepID=A0ABY7YRH3_9HYPH|nr:DUF2336 domain-containing protein [Devosia algicola]WDR03670.1 DUF2336 domain-containing protein [Devosia algicola]
MVAYQEFFALSQSSDSEQRGAAAHLAALAYLGHKGPADEQAGLYAALIGFLDDPSVKVRAALAYGLLHSPEAPRSIMLSLLHDSSIIARAVLQYSPVLVDADMVGLIPKLDLPMLLALSQRTKLSTRLAQLMLARDLEPLTLRLLRRDDVVLEPNTLIDMVHRHGAAPELRGALLRRKDLPAEARLTLVHAVADALAGTRIVKGAIAPERLSRLLRDSSDTALASIGEREAGAANMRYAANLVASDGLSTRVMLHAVIGGHVLFFADCLAELGDTPREKVFNLLDRGSRAALNALLVRCGLNEGVRNLLVRLILHARAADLADDISARHFVVTALTEELIAEHEGVIPHELEEAFSYLSEQNIKLARKAARGVMAAFATEAQSPMPLPDLSEPRLALPAA